MQKNVTFSENHFYHIFNRGNNKEIIFYNEKNYSYFLNKFDYYLSNYLDVFTYCLLPTHFHFLVKIKEKDEIKNLPGFKNLEGLYSINNHISKSFSNLFNAYAKAINKQQNRSGSLFQKNFKKKLIDKESYLTRIIYYIHLNPTHHKISNNYKDYRWSSFKWIVNEIPTKINRQEVLNLFESKESFIELHNMQYAYLQEIEDYLFE